MPRIDISRDLNTFLCVIHSKPPLRCGNDEINNSCKSHNAADTCVGYHAIQTHYRTRNTTARTSTSLGFICHKGLDLT